MPQDPDRRRSTGTMTPVRSPRSQPEAAAKGRAARVDGVLMVGFGGVTPGCCGRRPDCPRTPGCEVECFVSKVLGDDPRLGDRIESIAAHYRRIGGTSPYNLLTMQQAEYLEAELARRGRPMPVACGFRNWPPWFQDGLRDLRRKGSRRCAVLVMAPHQCKRSWDDYIDQVRATRKELGSEAPKIATIAPPFWDHPGYVAASASRIRTLAKGWDPKRYADAALVLTAHAIPVPAEKTSQYRRQVVASARRIAATAGHREWSIAFQSAPERSRVAWSSPKLTTVLHQCAQRGHKDVIIQAIGFLVDHVEVLYDLDVEARCICEELGMQYHRAPCVHEHPDFIGALADRVLGE